MSVRLPTIPAGGVCVAACGVQLPHRRGIADVADGSARSKMDRSSDNQQQILNTGIKDILHHEFDPVFVAAGSIPGAAR